MVVVYLDMSTKTTPSSTRVHKGFASAASSKTSSFDAKNISKWDIESTVNWLASIDYEDCGVYFREHRINGRALLMLDEDDLKEVIKHNVGQRKNLYHQIRMMQINFNRYMNRKQNSSFFSSHSDDEDDEDDDDSDDNNLTRNESQYVKEKSNNCFKFDKTKESKWVVNSLPDLMRVWSKEFLLLADSKNTNYDEDCNDYNHLSSSNNPNSLVHRHLINESQHEQNILGEKYIGSELNADARMPNQKDIFHNAKKNEHLFDEEENAVPNFCENCLKKFDHSPYSNFANMGNKSSQNLPIRCYKGEKRKTLVSMFYLFSIGLWTSFILTVVHDRVPDMQKYPPLPDLILVMAYFDRSIYFNLWVFHVFFCLIGQCPAYTVGIFCNWSYWINTAHDYLNNFSFP